MTDQQQNSIARGLFRLFSKALAAFGFIASTGSSSTTLRPPNCAVCTTKLTNSRTWSTRMAISFLRLEDKVVWVSPRRQQVTAPALTAGL